MKTSFLDGSLKILFLSSLIAYIVWLLPALVSSPNVTVNVFVCKFQFRNCVPPGKIMKFYRVTENIKIFVRVVQPKRDSAAVPHRSGRCSLRPNKSHSSHPQTDTKRTKSIHAACESYKFASTTSKCMHEMSKVPHIS